MADGDVQSPSDERDDVIILPKNVRFGTGGGSTELFAVVTVTVAMVFVVVLVVVVVVILEDAVATFEWAEFRRIEIADADGGANINLFVIGSAVFLINSIIVAFDGIPKLPEAVLGVDLMNKKK